MPFINSSGLFRYAVFGLIAAGLLVQCFPANAASTYKNTEKMKVDDALRAYKVDLWSGTPTRRYESLGQFQKEYHSASGSNLNATDMIYGMRKAVMEKGGDAIVGLRCEPKPPLKNELDEGDFVEKNTHLFYNATISRSLNCEGLIVKYR